MAEIPDRDAWQRNLTEMPGGEVYKRGLEEILDRKRTGTDTWQRGPIDRAARPFGQSSLTERPERYAWQKRLTDKPFRKD